MPFSLRSQYLPITLPALLLFFLFGCASSAGTADEASPAEAAQAEAATSGAFDEHIAASDTLKGLFTVYRDTTNGKLRMEIREDQLGEEFIYFTLTQDGAPVAGHFRGQFRANEVFKVRRYHNTLEFVKQNTRFYFDPDNALSRAADANITPAILASESIVAEDTTNGGRFLIDADALFLSEALHQVKPTPPPQPRPGQFQLGNLNREKTRYHDVRSFPENTDVVVEYVYDNPLPRAGGGTAVTDARSVGILVQHSLIKMPDNNFVPRFDDQRVGYFTQQIDDQTSTSATPYRDLINRWHLEKKDPEAEISDPVEPIVWWIENTTPEELRPAIKEATLAWNEAFEQAGISNAIAVKIQPDDADWQPGDIRYNMLRWTSSPTPPFGGYGPSFVNPRTGQILGADVMLEWVFLSNRVRQEQLFDTAALPGFDGEDGLHGDWFNRGDHDTHRHDHDGHAGCNLGLQMQQNMLLGLQALKARGASEIEMDDFVEEALYYLILHEVGHTLGLNHNMQAHNLLSPEELKDPSAIARQGMIGSVMDYPAVHLTANAEDQHAYYITEPGPYDIWAIQFGYDPRVDDEEYRKVLLARSTEPELAFGNDADDMRSPGKAIDPRVMINAMSNDPIAYSQERFALVNDLMRTLLEKYDEEGESYAPLRNAYMILSGEQATAANVVSRFIGGVYRDRSVIGQPGAETPFRPVERETQEAALQTLRDHIFAPDAFDAPEDLYNHLQMQRRGFGFSATTEDPKIHSRALNVQRAILAHIMHPVVLTRMTDSRMYGNTYPLAEYMGDLTNAVFEDDARGEVNTFRQQLQIEYVQRLAAVIDHENGTAFDTMARSAALKSLRDIQSMLRGKNGPNVETQAHTEHVRFLIDKALATG